MLGSQISELPQPGSHYSLHWSTWLEGTEKIACSDGWTEWAPCATKPSMGTGDQWDTRLPYRWLYNEHLSSTFIVAVVATLGMTITIPMIIILLVFLR